jgi:hypothetical protein
VLTLDIGHGRIAAICIVVNPEKLRAVPPLSWLNETERS